MKKKKLMFLACLPLLTLVSSCHKNCVCTAYNGAERVYTADEVDERGGNCSALVYQADTRLYTYCRWD